MLLNTLIDLNQCENFLQNSTFLLLFCTTVFYWMVLAFFSDNINSNMRSTISIFTQPIFQTLPIVFMAFSNFSLVALLLVRWKNSGHFPLSNLYESLMFLSWCCTFLYLTVNSNTITNTLNGLFTKNLALFSPQGTKERPSGYFKDKKDSTEEFISPSTASTLPLKVLSPSGGGNFFPYTSDTTIKQNISVSALRPNSYTLILGSLIAPCALLLNAFASFSLPKEMQQAAPLVPALQSNWLMMHVTVMIISYASLIIGSLLSILFLILNVSFSLQSEKNLKIQQKIALSESNDLGNSIPGTLFIPRNGGARNEGQDTKDNNIQLKRILLPLDSLSYRIIGLGFPFLTIGILSGAVWANEAWGSYWSWDPKETWALLTWLVFAIYLHTRLTKGWQGDKPAYIASIGFLVVWFCYLGVNLIGDGLHSYGFFT